MDEDQDPVCLGCHRSIEEGSVVAFGEGLWHVQCFRCAKCKNRVECDSNLLLLSDGSPICEQCSYNCHSCRQPILDEAIMTGDEAYHADCFRCIQCTAKIDDLVFAKTSQGIYCMNCHQERKEAKRQREERERMERAERMMEKLLPSIPDGEKRPTDQNWTTPGYTHLQQLPQVDQQPHQQQHQHLQQHQHQYQHQQQQQQQQQQQDHRQYHPPAFKHLPQSGESAALKDNLGLDMPRLPFSKSTRPDNGIHKSNKVSPLPRTEVKTNSGLPAVDVGPPFLPPLIFGLDDASTSSFDLGDMLADSDKPADVSAVPPKDTDIKALEVNSFRTSIGHTSGGLGTFSTTGSDRSSPIEGARLSSDVSELPSVNVLQNRFVKSMSLTAADLAQQSAASLADAEATIQELRMELAKYNPTNPLLHGTQQQEYGQLLEKSKKLVQEHADLEKSVRELHIEKDLLVMDLEAMQEELRANAEGTENSLMPTTPNPRFSTNHDFMKQAYQAEVKALQEQKESLQRDIQAFVAQRDNVLDEMQVLSVRNAELSTINNDMMREMQGRSDAKPKAASSNNDDRGRSADEHSVHKARKGDRSEDLFGEEIVAPKKFNWKKGTTNTVKSVGAMFGKLLVEGPTTTASSSSLEVPASRGGQLLSDSASANGMTAGARSFSSNSETRSLSERSMDQHSFIQHNYVRRTHCDCCDDKMWGREYKCRNCGFQAHSRCMHEVMPGCSGSYKDADSSSVRNMTPSGGSGHGVPPPPSSKQVMFGNDLLDQLEREQRGVPLVVEKCIEAVDERGLEVEGIYRRSGMAAEARQLVQAYDVGLQPDLNDTDIYQDICSITSVLKQYLRSLPEPLIPYDLYAEFIDAISLPQNDVKIQTFKDLMERMPFAYYQTLKVLLEHLNRVTQRDKINLMNAKNLSVVFGPTLMRNPDPSKEILDMTYKNMTIEFFITNTSELFVRNPRPSTSSSHGTARPSIGSSHERPSTSSNHSNLSAVASMSGSQQLQQQSQQSWPAQQQQHQQQQQQRQGPNSSNTPVAPPRRTNGGRSTAGGSTTLGGSTTPSPPSLPCLPSSGSMADLLVQPMPQSTPLGPPQPPVYQPTTQFRPQPYQPQAQQHPTLQQLHQKQLQLQMQQKQSQSSSTAMLPQQLQSPPTSQSPVMSYPQPVLLSATPHQQQANPEVDMTHFP